MAPPGLEDLPPELLHRVLLLCAIPDVLATAEALGRAGLLEVLARTHLWTRAAVGPRLCRESLPYLGQHTEHLTVQGHLKFDSRRRPRKVRYFRLCELVPSYLFTSLRHSCTSLSSLTFHRCALGPHTSLAALPTSLATLTFRSCVFVKKSSLFDSIWRQLPRLVELRIEDMVSFSRLDCHAVLTDLGIDFDIKFAANAASPSFIFYRKL